jgi:glucan 1,3-beta-glucosidase
VAAVGRETRLTIQASFFISRYRKQRGVNLGSFYTLEVWLTPSLFEGVSKAKSEYDLCKQLGEHKARERLENHWNTFVNQGDWQVSGEA